MFYGILREFGQQCNRFDLLPAVWKWEWGRQNRLQPSEAGSSGIQRIRLR
ncbi:unnamed protein product [Callosobruchus maculatus]|uniref:Uncharacterized protein n=1 Tax=Callosobruchus maculatus TaxID=64391 RepID=A0A653DV17_CALMS|nr:unnamed protein product [Callosobruchus maculatus]